jgi:hypothetical protein
MKNPNMTLKPIVNFLTALSLHFAIAAIVFSPELHAATPTTPRAFHVKSQWNVGGKGDGVICASIVQLISSIFHAPIT